MIVERAVDAEHIPVPAIWRGRIVDLCVRVVHKLISADAAVVLIAREAVKQPTSDSDGHCTRCGLEWEDDITHECPPGFTTPLPPADPWALLAELVAVKDIKEQIDAIVDDANHTDGPRMRERDRLVAEYEKRKPLAWAAARRTLKRRP